MTTKREKLDQLFNDGVAKERLHQLTLGYDADHDDLHVHGELYRAGMAFLTIVTIGSDHITRWPWKDSPMHVRDELTANLMTAAALFLAEGERLDRLEARGYPVEGAKEMLDVTYDICRSHWNFYHLSEV